MGLFGGCNNNDSDWIWIVIIIVLIFACGDNSIFGSSNNNSCCRECDCRRRDNECC